MNVQLRLNRIARAEEAAIPLKKPLFLSGKSATLKAHEQAAVD